MFNISEDLMLQTAQGLVEEHMLVHNMVRISGRVFFSSSIRQHKNYSTARDLSSRLF
jgi:hypothetical protein